MNGGRAEAKRWLTAAEKLLATRDFPGTRRFAHRARESDPGLEAAELILAVVDTLIAGESLVNGQQPDWYGILQLNHLTQSVELIADHYRRLALLLNPGRNHFPFVDQAFKLVSEAWSVLSNPNNKAFYDNQLRFFQFSHLGFQSSTKKSPKSKELHAPPPTEQPPTFNNDVQPSSQRRRPGRPPSASSAATSQVTDSPELASFWTTCPYCYMLYEFHRAYEDCALKCQECERAFEAVEVAPPPVANKDTFYNCWAYFPLGLVGSDRGTGNDSNWTPLSSMFIPPTPNGRRPRGAPAGPRVYYDDDIYVDFSDSSDDSDDADWNGPTTVKKRGRGRPPKANNHANKSDKKKTPLEKSRHAQQIATEQLSADDLENLGAKPTGQPTEGAESSPKGLGNSMRKQRGRRAKSPGKLDLNVEFSNEGEELARAVNIGNRRGHGEEDNTDGTGFFEGLDEFLNSLPILSGMNDDKVKAA